MDGLPGAGDFLAEGAEAGDAVGLHVKGIVGEFAAGRNGRDSGAPGDKGRRGDIQARGQLHGVGVDGELGAHEVADFAAAKQEIKRDAEPRDEENHQPPGEDVARGALLEHEPRADEQGEQEADEDAQVLAEEVPGDLPEVVRPMRRLGQQGGRGAGEGGEHPGIMNYVL